MKEVPNIGELCDPGDNRRDAIHVAVVPVKVWHDMEPGDHVMLDETCRPSDPEVYGCLMNDPKAIGIIDPFLKKPVKAGERCWLFLYPNTITGLRHVWTHPAFKARV
jgi:hypothetical protein